MGASYTAQSAIGVFVPRDVLVKKVRKPSCEHDATARKGKHCAECGKKVEFLDVKDSSLIDDDNFLHIAGQAGLGCLTVYRGEYKFQGYVVGLVQECGEYDKLPSMCDLPTRAELASILSGFFARHNIGGIVCIPKLITNLYCSF